MPAFGPTSRKDLIRYLKKLGFEGPYKGKKHDFMVKGDLTPRVPDPHRVKSVKTCSAGFSNKPISRTRSGAGSKSPSVSP
jgi:hypothetical protein